MLSPTFIFVPKRAKTAVRIGVRRRRQLHEDVYDARLVETRAREPRVSLEFVKRRLKLAKARG